MLDASDSIALTAFIISLAALAVANLQLLQQYFATANGYSRCARRFIGDWSRFRHRRYVWSEFRLEVGFIRPHIFLGSIDEDSQNQLVDRQDHWTLLDLIPSVRRDKAWRAKYLGRSIRVSQLDKEDFQDVRKNASWTVLVRDIRLVEENINRRVRVPLSTTDESHPLSGMHPRHDTEETSGGVDDRMLEDGTASNHKQETVPSPFGINIRFEPCTWDDSNLEVNGSSLTGTASIRDLAVLARLLGLTWHQGPFIALSHTQSLALDTEAKMNTDSLQALGNKLSLTGSVRPRLRYEQREASPPILQRSRRETYLLHHGTLAMFYGHLLPDPILLPGYPLLVIDGPNAWEACVTKLWMQQRHDSGEHDEETQLPRSGLVNCLVPLCSAIIGQADVYAVRVPKPHQHLIGPFVRPKVVGIFRRGLDGLLQEREAKAAPGNIVQLVTKAIDDLEQYPRGEHGSKLSYWAACQGGAPRWTDLDTIEGRLFLHKVHGYLTSIQNDLAVFIGRSDGIVTSYQHFYWDLVAAFLDYVVAAERGEYDSGHKHPGKGPFARWRRTMESLFQHLDVIESGLRKRGRRRALMCANGILSANLDESFEAVVPLERHIQGYDAINPGEVREACIAMLFRAMCWHRCHFMHPQDAPFHSEFYTNIQEAIIE
ncbi:hypothetical protein BO71DRAFT_331335 [Aspergillus ellipticus CBS 707.79]|uniref:Uncharacterized protein n=1 Tax=Aspergillus ellipticus CBS 707.79 TaxID=1448320 RepID=A0A319DKM3_9EURO|nr:hypothetical protein BO71DRAFT_331335 [Aspergillus ellipticus CBS 707.79]